MEQREVDANGVRLRCVVDGSGPLVVLLHGFPQTAYAWRRQIPALAERFQVVAPDLRGYGGSDKPAGVASYRASVLAGDIVALVRSFGAERAHVVGHDWGGAVAWTVAIGHPGVVDRLAIINAPHPTVMARALRTSWAQLRRSWYIFAFQIPWLPERMFLRSNGKLLRDALRGSSRPGTFSDADLDVYANALAAPGAATATLNYYRAAFREGLRRRASSGTVAAPTLLIWGEDDVALGKELTLGLDRYCTGGIRVEYVPKTSHWVMEERPDLVNRLLLDFLVGLPSAPSPRGSRP